MIPTIETTYKIPGAPPLALLTDFHNTDPEPILDSLCSHAPSLICIAGDIIVGRRPEGDKSPLETQTNVLPFLSACADIAPTFLSLGNHEWMLDATDLAAISSTEVTVLDNSWVEMDGVVIGGLTSGYVTDYHSFREEVRASVRYPHLKDMHGIGGTIHAGEHKPETAWIHDFIAAPGYHILLCHHPEYWPVLRDMNIDLILSGHAHGGQWRIYNPFKKESIGVYAPGQGWFPKWTRGVYENKLVVSAGLRNTAWVPRICNPTEIVYLGE